MPDLRDGEPQNANDAATDRVPDDATTSKLPQYGVHESYMSYQSCKARFRNGGLYIADRKINGNGIGSKAISTRQNPNGARRGFECPEERDYYPYWHPTPWRDIAVLVKQQSDCARFVPFSQNTMAKGYCVAKGAACGSGSSCLHLQWNNATGCTGNGGEWRMQPSHGMAAPACHVAPFNRDNSLGNGFNTLFGSTNSYLWTIPSQPAAKCVLRLRYNISTADNSPTDDHTLNGEKSFPQTDPYIDLATAGGQPMLLATNINTNQYGRTFQDRSYVFEIRARPANVAASFRIQNLNVRGKRGNIVQTYPAVEYDFVPQTLVTDPSSYVHFQWIGSDYNAPRNPNDGEGQSNSDRHNFVQIQDQASNVPVLASSPPTTPDTRTDQKNRKVYPMQPAYQLMFNGDPAVINRMAFLGQNPASCKVVTALNNDGTRDDTANCAKLNPSVTKYPYFDGGLVHMRETGTYHYMSTRNNNFSNRSQKGRIIVVASSSIRSTWQGTTAPGLDGEPIPPHNTVADVLAVVGAVIGVGAMVGLFVKAYRRALAGGSHWPVQSKV